MANKKTTMKAGPAPATMSAQQQVKHFGDVTVTLVAGRISKTNKVKGEAMTQLQGKGTCTVTGCIAAGAPMYTVIAKAIRKGQAISFQLELPTPQLT